MAQKIDTELFEQHSAWQIFCTICSNNTARGKFCKTSVVLPCYLLSASETLLLVLAKDRRLVQGYLIFMSEVVDRICIEFVTNVQNIKKVGYLACLICGGLHDPHI